MNHCHGCLHASYPQYGTNNAIFVPNAPRYSVLDVTGRCTCWTNHKPSCRPPPGTKYLQHYACLSPYPSPRPPALFALQNDKSNYIYIYIYIYSTRSVDLLQEQAMTCYLQKVLRQCDTAEGRVCSRASARGLYGEHSDPATRFPPSTSNFPSRYHFKNTAPHCCSPPSVTDDELP